VIRIVLQRRGQQRLANRVGIFLIGGNKDGQGRERIRVWRRQPRLVPSGIKTGQPLVIPQPAEEEHQHTVEKTEDDRDKGDEQGFGCDLVVGPFLRADLCEMPNHHGQEEERPHKADKRQYDFPAWRNVLRWMGSNQMVPRNVQA